MKLKDKRFWIFEAIVLICSLISMIISWANHFMLRPILFPAAFCFLFLVGSIIAWKLYNGNQWWKLAGYTLLSTTVLLAIVLFGLV